MSKLYDDEFLEEETNLELGLNEDDVVFEGSDEVEDDEEEVDECGSKGCKKERALATSDFKGKQEVEEDDDRGEELDLDDETVNEMDEIWTEDYDFYTEGEDCDDSNECTPSVNRGNPECPDQFQKKRKAAYAAGPNNDELEGELTSKMDLRFDDGQKYDSQTIPDVGINGRAMDEFDPYTDLGEDDDDDVFIDIDPDELDDMNDGCGNVED